MRSIFRIFLITLAGLLIALAGGLVAYRVAVKVAPVKESVQTSPQPLSIIYRSIELPALPHVPEEQPASVIEGTVLSDVPFGPPLPPPKPVKAEGGKGRIVIIIDDMGMDLVHSKGMIALPGPLTLAFLPYAPKVRSLAEQAKARGHTLMIHMPMQPVDPKLDLGSIALREGMSASDFDAMMDKAFHSFSGYIGLNNHMGSLLTQDNAAMARLMAILKLRRLLFVDSRTTPKSVAARAAMTAGVPYTSRDIFLDDDESERAVMASLIKVEQVARKSGLAVAIGHPRAGTLAALQEWLPTLRSKGLELVPVTQAVSQSR